MDTLTGMKRTDYCGNFTTEQIGQEVTVYGLSLIHISEPTRP